jgi:hypothetical protein
VTEITNVAEDAPTEETCCKLTTGGSGLGSRRLDAFSLQSVFRRSTAGEIARRVSRAMIWRMGGRGRHGA